MKVRALTAVVLIAVFATAIAISLLTGGGACGCGPAVTATPASSAPPPASATPAATPTG